MASNEIPKSYDALIELMEDAADGAHTHGGAVGLKQNTEADIRLDLEALTGRAAGPGGVPPAVPGLRSLLSTPPEPTRPPRPPPCARPAATVARWP